MCEIRQFLFSLYTTYIVHFNYIPINRQTETSEICDENCQTHSTPKEEMLIKKIVK